MSSAVRHRSLHGVQRSCRVYLLYVDIRMMTVSCESLEDDMFVVYVFMRR